MRTGYTASDSTEETLYSSASKTSSYTEEITCFNLFLLTNNLPLLTHNKTLGSLLNYLQNLSFKQPFKISINQHQTESHIYTNIKDSLLPNHTLLIPEKLYKFYNLPIRTILKIPHIDSNTLLHQNYLPDYTTHESPTTPHSDNTIQTQTLKIHSLNTNGLLEDYKQLSLIDYITENQIDIFGISETHLNLKEAKYSTLSKNLTNYQKFWAPCIHRRGGVGIIIHKQLAKHVGKIQTFKNFLIEIDLYFKNNHIKLIQIYFPTQEKKQQRKEILTYLTLILNATIYKTIIMGDLNGTPDPKIDRLPAKKYNSPEN